VTAKANEHFRDCGKEIMLVRKSGVCVRVFKAARKGCTSYVIAYYLKGQRVRETFRGILDDAKARAEEIANQICSQAAGDGILPMADVQIYCGAVDALKPLGVPLAVAVQEYVAARRRISGRSLAEAADYFARHACLDLPPKPLAEVAQEMLSAKKADGASRRWRQQLRYAIEPACDAVKKPIAEITPADLDDYLRGLTVSTRSRHNIRAALVTLFEFAKSRGYLPRDRETAAALAARVKVRTGEIEIFTPDEMAALLKNADADTLPLIALAGLAGLRTAEIARLERKDVDLVQKLITVSAAKSKTASRRIVPIQANLAQWLAPWANASGPVLRFNNTTKLQMKVAKAAKVTWKHNALRHSFGSYRLATIKNAAEVALEMGNSPAMVFRHYRELVAPAAATAWWAIMPETPGNVTVFNKTATP